jgi:ADP-L-glycero-D-manno-heptose 6-epimerase
LSAPAFAIGQKVHARQGKVYYAALVLANRVREGYEDFSSESEMDEQDSDRETQRCPGTYVKIEWEDGKRRCHLPAANVMPLDVDAPRAKRGVPFIYASSAATYGNGALGFDDDVSEAALAKLRPLNLYGWSKLAFDRRVAQMLTRGQARPPQWAGLRFFNVYGPNEHHKGRMASVVLHKFRQIMAGEAATLFASDREGVADGEQMRDFVHVDDCVAAMLWLHDNPGTSGLFNIGSGTARSFLDLTRAIYAALDRAPDIRFVPMPDDLKGNYQYFTEARMERLRAAGFRKNPTTLEAGVASYVRDVLLRAEDPFA